MHYIFLCFFSYLFWIYPTHCEWYVFECLNYVPLCIVIFETVKLAELTLQTLFFPLGVETQISFLLVLAGLLGVCLMSVSFRGQPQNLGLCAPSLLSGIFSLTFQWLWFFMPQRLQVFVGVSGILSGENWGCSLLPTVLYFLRLNSLTWNCWANEMFMYKLTFSLRAVYQAACLLSTSW